MTSKILSFDPSSTNLGWAAGTSDVSIRGMNIHASGCITDKLLKKYVDENIPFDWPTKYKIITAISSAIKEVVDREEPDLIFIENPFNYRFPHVFSTLVVVVHEIHRGIISSKKEKKPCPFMVAPAEGKKLVTTKYNPDGSVDTTHKPNVRDKNPVQEAVQNHPFITFSEGMSFDAMTEHEYDACGVMYAGLEMISGRHVKPIKKKKK